MRDRSPLAYPDRVHPETETVAAVVAHLLDTLGADRGREGLRDTPARAAAFWREWLTPIEVPITTFDAEGTNEMIVIGSIPFYAVCEHHLLPFFGTATVGYVPEGRIVGLSKIPRIVQAMARGFQTQERITGRIAETLADALTPKGVGVILHGRHLCMEMRGIRIPGAHTTTSALRGVFLDDARARREFLDFDRDRGTA